MNRYEREFILASLHANPVLSQALKEKTILVVDEDVMVSHHIQRLAQEMLLIRDFQFEEPQVVGEIPKPIQYGPQRNTRKGKQRRW